MRVKNEIITFIVIICLLVVIGFAINRTTAFVADLFTHEQMKSKKKKGISREEWEHRGSQPSDRPPEKMEALKEQFVAFGDSIKGIGIASKWLFKVFELIGSQKERSIEKYGHHYGYRFLELPKEAKKVAYPKIEAVSTEKQRQQILNEIAIQFHLEWDPTTGHYKGRTVLNNNNVGMSFFKNKLKTSARDRNEYVSVTDYVSERYPQQEREVGHIGKWNE